MVPKEDTVAEAATIFAAYGERLTQRGAGTTALREYRLTTEAFLAYLNDRGLEIDQVGGDQIEDFMAQTGWAVTTQRSRLTWLRSPWRYAVNRMGIPLADPFYDGIRLKKGPVREVKVIPPPILRKIRARAELRGPTDRVLFGLLAYEGMRSVEIRRLEWNGVSFADQTLNFIGKDDRERTIPMHPYVQVSLNELGVFAGGSPYVLRGQRGGEMTAQGVWQKTKTMCRPHQVSPHDFRRTWNSSLEINEALPSAIKQIGWGKTRSGDIRLDHYTALPQKVLMRELLKVYRDDPV